eukprot:4559782-Pleurochrysis_carterae.AAC.2
MASRKRQAPTELMEARAVRREGKRMAVEMKALDRERGWERAWKLSLVRGSQKTVPRPWSRADDGQSLHARDVETEKKAAAPVSAWDQPRQATPPTAPAASNAWVAAVAAALAAASLAARVAAA